MADFVGPEDLLTDGFDCCTNQELEPLKCPSCKHIVVWCYESSDLFPDLHNLEYISGEVNRFDPNQPAFHCPQCGYPFEYYFPQNPIYKVTRQDLYEQGLAFILEDA